MLARIAAPLVALACVLSIATPADAAPERIAYLDQRQLFVTDVGGSPRPLNAHNPTDLTGAAWSPDGKRLVYITSPDELGIGPYAFRLRVIDVARNRERDLVRIDLCCGLPVGVMGQFAHVPSWSPDGRWIAFLSSTIVCPSWGVCGAQTSLEVVRANGTGRRVVAPDVHQILTEIAWSPDGERIAYEAASGIKVVRVDGIGAPRQVSPPGKDAWGPAWSRRGPLAFVVGEHTDVLAPRKGTIWVADANAKNAREVGGVTSEAPSWSPDARSLAYGDGGIKIIQVAGGTTRAVTPSTARSNDDWPRWSPSGRSIVFARRSFVYDDPTTLRTVDVATKRVETITWSPLYSPTYGWAPN